MSEANEVDALVMRTNHYGYFFNDAPLARAYWIGRRLLPWWPSQRKEQAISCIRKQQYV